MNCWGWATWADRWAHFEKDPAGLAEQVSADDILRFDLDGAQDFWKQVTANASGEMNTWAVFWYTTIFKQGGLCLSPHRSYTKNIGFDGSGTHCNDPLRPAGRALNLEAEPPLPTRLVEDPVALERLRRHYRDQRTVLAKVRRRWHRAIRKLTPRAGIA